MPKPGRSAAKRAGQARTPGRAGAKSGAARGRAPAAPPHPNPAAPASRAEARAASAWDFQRMSEAVPAPADGGLRFAGGAGSPDGSPAPQVEAPSHCLNVSILHARPPSSKHFLTLSRSHSCMRVLLSCVLRMEASVTARKSQGPCWCLAKTFRAQPLGSGSPVLGRRATECPAFDTMSLGAARVSS